MDELIKIYNESWENSPKHISNNTVDLFFCDPPYYIKKSKKSIIDLENGDINDWDHQWESVEDFYKWTKLWMDLAYLQLSPLGSMYVCIYWKHSGNFQNLLKQSGFFIQNRITWKRDKGRGAKRNWKSMHEDIWFVTKHLTNYTFNLDAVKVEKEVIAPYKNEDGQPKDWFMNEHGKKIRYTHPGNLWDEFVVPFWSMKEVRSYAKTKKSLENVLIKHNTQKPKDLVKKCIIASSNEDDLVVDYFLGSGTTAVASKELKRNFIGFDINKKCIEMTDTRLKNEN